MSTKRISIAIDGHSSSGKSTMAKQLAKHLGYSYIDTGAMYRAVTLFALQHGFINEQSAEVDAEALQRALPQIDIEFKIDAATGAQSTWLCGECVEQEIRAMRVSSFVSKVAAIAAVRHALVAIQQQMGKDGGIVMDGRDIGTVVLPDAEMKVFVDASPERRAQRRYDEMKAKGDSTVTYDEVLKNVLERDYADTHRAESPLRKAEDALVLDNSDMTREEQNQWLIDRFNEITAKL